MPRPAMVEAGSRPMPGGMLGGSGLSMEPRLLPIESGVRDCSALR